MQWICGLGEPEVVICGLGGPEVVICGLGGPEVVICGLGGLERTFRRADDRACDDAGPEHGLSEGRQC